jgi:hypothetical protein
LLARFVILHCPTAPARLGIVPATAIPTLKRHEFGSVYLVLGLGHLEHAMSARVTTILRTLGIAVDALPRHGHALSDVDPLVFRIPQDSAAQVLLALESHGFENVRVYDRSPSVEPAG